MAYLRIGIALLVAALGVSYWVGGNLRSRATVDRPATTSEHPSHSAKAERVVVAPLATGERWVDLAMPGGNYTP
jgi:hypothetical protein